MLKFILLICPVLFPTQLLMAASSQNCNILLATGRDYSISSGELPDDYSLKLNNDLAEKGYNVVKRMVTGDYTWDEKVNEEAKKLNANVLLFRPALGKVMGNISYPIPSLPIAVGHVKSYFCRMSITSIDSESGLKEYDVTFTSDNTKYFKKVKCDEIYKKILNSIPNCSAE